MFDQREEIAIHNITSVKEWLVVAFHNLQSAKILYEVNHYTDSIENDLQQSIEKILKSILAVENKRIPKSHDLLEVYEKINDKITFKDDEFLILAKAWLKSR